MEVLYQLSYVGLIFASYRRWWEEEACSEPRDDLGVWCDWPATFWAGLAAGRASTARIEADFSAQGAVR
jgi:hypothetical protein